MNINKIKSAYIKNKPSYNYQIKDDQGNLIAKGHLLSSRQKQSIVRMIKTDVDQNGDPVSKMDSYIDFSIQ